MSNYIVTTDFAVKDTYAHGDSRKVAKGADVATELNNIATAITSKQDTSAKNVANGYAGLDASALVALSQIPSLSASQITSGTFALGRLGTGSPTSSNFLRGDGTWAAVALSNLSGYDSNTNHFLRGDGTLTTVGTGAITGLATSATTDTTNASNITSGTLASGRLPAVAYRNTTSGSGNVTIQSGGSPSGGSDGDIFLIY